MNSVPLRQDADTRALSCRVGGAIQAV